MLIKAAGDTSQSALWVSQALLFHQPVCTRAPQLLPAPGGTTEVLPPISSPPSPHHSAGADARGHVQTGATTAARAGVVLLREGMAQIPPFNELSTIRDGSVLPFFCTPTLQFDRCVKEIRISPWDTTAGQNQIIIVTGKKKHLRFSPQQGE